jgi:hypothetical protein
MTAPQGVGVVRGFLNWPEIKSRGMKPYAGEARVRDTAGMTNLIINTGSINCYRREVPIASLPRT